MKNGTFKRKKKKKELLMIQLSAYKFSLHKLINL